MAGRRGWGWAGEDLKLSVSAHKWHLENRWLLQQVASAFVAGQVDGVLLRELDEDDLVELGVDSGIARKKILLALAQLSDATYDSAGWSGRGHKANTPAKHGGPSSVSSSNEDSDG